MNFLRTKIGIYLFSEKFNTIKFQNIPKTNRLKIVYFQFYRENTVDCLILRINIFFRLFIL